MQIDSSAMRTGRELVSGWEWAITVRMPISRQVRRIRSAISPRLAMRILWNMGAVRPLLERLQQEQGLAELDGLSVVDEDLDDAPADLCVDLVHELHGLDHAEGLPFFDGVTLADERSRLRAGGAVEGPDHGRLDR